MGESRKYGHGGSHESSGERRHRRHRSKSRHEERGRHHRSPRDDRHSRSRHRRRDEERGKHYERSRSQDRRPRSRRRYEDNGVLDPVVENLPNDSLEYQTTGGAGLAETLRHGHRKPDTLSPRGGERRGSVASGYQTSWRDLKAERKNGLASGSRVPPPYSSAQRPPKGLSTVRSHSRGRRDTSQSDRKRSHTPRRPHHRKSRERSSSHRGDIEHNKRSDIRSGRIGASYSPTRRQRGPDGTPFGSLSERKSKDTFGNHFMNTYRHIKAEHEAGYRSKGKLEKALDEMRKKKRVTKVSSDAQTTSHKRDREKIRKSEPERVRWVERYPEKPRGDEGKPKAAETEAWEHHRREEEEHKRRKDDDRRREKDVDQTKIRSLPVKPLQSHQTQPKTTVPRQPQYHSDQTTASGETEPKPKPNSQPDPKRSYRNQSARPKTVELQIPETNSPKRNISTLPPVPEIRLQPPTSARAPRRQLHPVVSKSSHPPTHRPASPVPEPSHWQHSLPQRPLTIREETFEHETSSQREPAGRGVDGKSEIGSAASYYDQAPRSPMPGSYEEGDETEYEEDDQPETYNEMPYPDTPSSPVIPPYSDTLPSAVGSEDPSVSSSPIMSHTPRAASPSPRSTSAFLQSIQMPTPQQSVPPTPPLPSPPAPPPPPPPPPLASPLPAVRPPNNTGMAALFGEIGGGGFKLRKVADSEKRHRNNNPTAGRVVYEETAHSHDVEEHERAQAREANNQSPFRGNSVWSTRISMEDEDDIQPVPNRAFQNDLAKALQARRSGSGTDTSTRGPRRGSEDISLTAGSRTSMIANVSEKLRDESTLMYPHAW